MSNPKAIFDEMIAKDAFSQWLAIELLEISEGYCLLQMEVRADMLNGFDILHGGVTFAFADSAFAFASNSHGRLSVSLNASITYANAAKIGDILLAEAQQLSLGNKTATFDVNITQKLTQEKVAFFRGTVYRTSKILVE
jgi:acyl-CoA thioesterase